MIFEYQLADLRSKNPSLESVYVQQISEEQLDSLLQALENNTSVRELVIRDTDFKPEHLTYIASFLADKQITVLDLRGCQIGDNGIKKLSIGLAGNTSITSLHLGNNNLSHVSDEPLAGIIRTLPNLETLSLDKNSQLELYALSKFLNELIASKTLKSLDLSDQTVIGVGGMGKIIKLIKNPVLESLSLNNTVLWPGNYVITQRNAPVRFIEALKKNTGLKKLELHLSDKNNCVSTEIKELKDKVKSIISEREGQREEQDNAGAPTPTSQVQANNNAEGGFVGRPLLLVGMQYQELDYSNAQKDTVKHRKHSNKRVKLG